MMAGFRLMLTDRHGVSEELNCDCVVRESRFSSGPRPFEELQIHRCYATEGPIKMAAHLLGESGTVFADRRRRDLLNNPEPNFYILGAASYGRDSRFLLQNGFEQVARSSNRYAEVRRRIVNSYVGRPSPQIELRSLDELWFQVAGTVCNLTCHHCFISCSPQNHSFEFLSSRT